MRWDEAHMKWVEGSPFEAEAELPLRPLWLGAVVGIAVGAVGAATHVSVVGALGLWITGGLMAIAGLLLIGDWSASAQRYEAWAEQRGRRRFRSGRGVGAFELAGGVLFIVWGIVRLTSVG